MDARARRALREARERLEDLSAAEYREVFRAAEAANYDDFDQQEAAMARYLVERDGPRPARRKAA